MSIVIFMTDYQHLIETAAQLEEGLEIFAEIDNIAEDCKLQGLDGATFEQRIHGKIVRIVTIVSLDFNADESDVGSEMTENSDMAENSDMTHTNSDMTQANSETTHTYNDMTHTNNTNNAHDSHDDDDCFYYYKK